jgi:Fe-S cluster assembly protein SufD
MKPRKLTAEFPFLDAFDDVVGATAGVDWLAAARGDALDRFRTLALPSTRVEDWKYTNLRDLAQTSFELPDPASDEAAAATAASTRPLAGGKFRLVFVNGRLDAGLSSLGPLPEGVRLGGLGNSLAGGDDTVRARLSRGSDLPADALLELNTAFMMDGCVLIVDDGVAMPHPIEVVHVGGAATKPISFHPRNLMVLGSDASAAVLETHVGVPGANYWSNPVTQIDLGAGAKLTHVVSQRDAHTAYHISTTQAVLSERASYDTAVVVTGGRLARHTIAVRLAGADATCSLTGAYLGRGRQHIDVTTRVEHAVGGGTSDQLFKGVLDDRSHGVFQGGITVQPNAQKTNGHQLNRALLLSPEAAVDTKPELEILADDVKCSHGASAGELNEDEIFYARARGIDPDDARRLLVRAFIVEILDRIPDAVARSAIEAEVDGWLGSLEGGGDVVVPGGDTP